jgi:hypothetical protein
MKNSTSYVGEEIEINPSKNWCMPLGAASTRYSLVKGERIVRSVPTAWLYELHLPVTASYIGIVLTLGFIF